MQHDRFAREIVGILALSYAARLRRLMRNPLARSIIAFVNTILARRAAVWWSIDARTI